MNNSSVRVVCFDLNETLIKEKTWPELNFAMGMTKEENAKFYRQYKSGEIDYSMWVSLALEIYQKRNNLKREEIEKVVQNYCYFPFAQEIVFYLKQKYTVVLVSGAMGILVKKVAKELEIDHHKALTDFFFDEFGYISKIAVDDRTGNDSKNKVLFLEEICNSLGCKLENCVSVGDGENDYDLFGATKGITFNHSERSFKEIAWRVVADLNEIKNIL
jgi:HAD superfamily phosphoserine phosphatase-like hydrolase